MSGIMGKILIVDLSTGTYREETIPEEIYHNYLAGVGLGAHYLYENIPAGADPLGPDNILGFVAGVLTGTGALFSGRWLAVGLIRLPVMWTTTRRPRWSRTTWTAGASTAPGCAPSMPHCLKILPGSTDRLTRAARGCSIMP